MFRVARMTLVDLLVLERDLCALTTALGERRICEFVPLSDVREERYAAEIEELAALLARARQTLHDFLPETAAVPAEPVDAAAARALLVNLVAELAPFAPAITACETRIVTCEKTLAALSGFADFAVELGALGNMRCTRLFHGTVPATGFAELAASPDFPGLLIPLAAPPGTTEPRPVLALCAPDDEAALETFLAGVAFHRLPLPATAGKSDALVSDLARTRADAARERDALVTARSRIATEQGAAFAAACAAIERRLLILRTMQGFPHTTTTARIRAWVPKSRLEEFRELVRETGAECSVLEATDPFALPPDERRTLAVPVILRNNPLVRPFEALVKNYGYPVYGEIEPTPLVALGFILMFGVMFGDVGQGAILVAAGLFLARSRRLSASLRQTGRLVAAVGASAAFFGFVFGSVFCLEGVIHPLWREPLAAFGNIMTLFVAAVLLGIAWISVGLVCNIVNRLFFRDWEGAFLGKTGLAGLAFYWGALLPPGLAAAGLTAEFSPEILLATAGVPLLLIVLREPLAERLRHRRAFPHGIATWAVEALIECIETATYYIGNTFSFVRVGAFALAHGGLALAVTSLASLAGGGIAGVLILAGGNLLVIVLEGMVVSIQTLRLEYYEFFSKFYSGAGRPFVPFAFAA